MSIADDKAPAADSGEKNSEKVDKTGDDTGKQNEAMNASAPKKTGPVYRSVKEAAATDKFISIVIPPNHIESEERQELRRDLFGQMFRLGELHGMPPGHEEEIEEVSENARIIAKRAVSLDRDRLDAALEKYELGSDPDELLLALTMFESGVEGHRSVIEHTGPSGESPYETAPERNVAYFDAAVKAVMKQPFQSFLSEVRGSSQLTLTQPEWVSEDIEVLRAQRDEMAQELWRLFKNGARPSRDIVQQAYEKYVQTKLRYLQKKHQTGQGGNLKLEEA